jgi:CubicO group peptidase (beta-lactamase class C family)
MVFPKNEFNKISCKEANINKGILVDMFNKIEDKQYNIHSMILLKDGSKVFDAYAHDFSEETRSNVYSVSKSFLSIALGILIDRKLLDLENYVLFYFSEEVKDYLKEYEKLKVKHLLTMTENPFEIFFNIPLVNEPGSTFLYNNFASAILSAIVTKITGVSLNDFLEKNLYDIIGIDKPHWDSFNGISLGCTGLNINLNDMARFGLLLLNDGKWDQTEVISKDYLDKAFDKHIQEPNTPLFYGYHFWISSQYVFAAGMFRQYVVVDKRYNLVFAMQAYEENDVLGLYNNYIVKAIEKGWNYCEYSLRDFIRKFKINSIPLVEKEKKERTY